MKHGKCIFVPQGEYSRMRTTNLNLMMQKGSRVVQMIIAHKSLHIIYLFGVASDSQLPLAKKR